MTMLGAIAVFSLIMCLLNWLLFVGITFLKDMPELKAIHDALKAPAGPHAGMGVTAQHALVDPTKLAAATGTLAGAFSKAGPAPTAAALSVLFLFVALAAASVAKI